MRTRHELDRRATARAGGGTTLAAAARVPTALRRLQQRLGNGGIQRLLPFLETIQRAFGPEHDLSTIRAHVGPGATAASAALSARAYATGSDVVFGEAPTLALAAHEATHVIQQRAGATVPGGVGRPGDAYELQAQAVAARVSRGQSAADLLAPYREAAVPAAQLQLDAAAGGTPTGSANQAVVEAVLAALSRPDPIAGVGDFPGAFAALEPLPMDALLQVLTELQQRGWLEVLAGNEGAALARPDGARIVAAMRTVRVSSPAAAGETEDQLVDDARRIAAVSAWDLDVLLQYLARTLKGVGGEGVLAMYSMMASSLPLLPGAVAAAGGPVMPGPWARPGQQPVPFYIGLSAHAEIAVFYLAEHPGQAVAVNNIAISTILARLALLGRPNTPGAVSLEKLGLEPDIANLSRLHLYEIKPQSLQSLAAVEAAMYMAIFLAAGVPMTLGSTVEPGTAGVVPAPGGYYAFEAPQPGVIIYQYRRGKYQPVPVPVEAEAKEPAKASDPDFMKKMAAITGLSGTALIVYLIISEGTRVVIPPRNLIPVP